MPSLKGTLLKAKHIVYLLLYFHSHHTCYSILRCTFLQASLRGIKLKYVYWLKIWQCKFWPVRSSKFKLWTFYHLTVPNCSDILSLLKSCIRKPNLWPNLGFRSEEFSRRTWFLEMILQNIIYLKTSPCTLTKATHGPKSHWLIDLSEQQKSH